MDNPGFLLLFVISFCLFYVLNHFFINSIRSINDFTKKIFEVLVICGIGITFELILNLYVMSGSMYVFLAIIPMLLYANSLWSCYVALAIGIIFYGSYYQLDDFRWILWIELSLLVAIAQVCRLFRLKMKFTLIAGGLIGLVGNGIYVVTLGMFYQYSFIGWISQLFGWLVLSGLSIGILKSIKNIIGSTNALYQSSLLAINGYYRSAKFKELVLNFIFRHRITSGVLCLIEFDFKHQVKYDDKQIEVARVQALDRLRHILRGQKAIFFQANEHHFGFFMNIDLQKNTNSKYADHHWYRQLMRKLDDLGSEISDESQIPYKPYFGFSVYGSDSNDISRLVSNCEFALYLSRKLREKRYNFFDYQQYQKNVKDGYEIAKLNQVIRLKSIFPAFFSIYDYSHNELLMHFARPSFDVLIAEEKNIISLLRQSHLWETFLRYISMRAIRIFTSTEKKSGKSLGIFYSIDFFGSQHFSHKSFIEKIKSESMPLENLVVFLDINRAFSTNERNLILRNYVACINKGIHFGLIDVGGPATDLILLRSFKNVYWNFHNSLFEEKVIDSDDFNAIINPYLRLAKKQKAKIMFSHITTKSTIRKLLSAKIDYFGGPIFENYEFTPKKYNKKSTIYVREVIEEG